MKNIIPSLLLLLPLALTNVPATSVAVPNVPATSVAVPDTRRPTNVPATSAAVPDARRLKSAVHWVPLSVSVHTINNPCANLCDGSAEALVNTWTGAGDATYWSDADNWSDGFVPLPCQDVVIPAGGTVTVQAGYQAYGKTLTVSLTALLTVVGTAVMTIQN